jgi:hypothetical protein
LYRMADKYLGYYDYQQPEALEYQGSTLKVHVLFETKASALHFDSQLRVEKVRMGSALNSQDIQVSVKPWKSNLAVASRIYYGDYIAAESDSTQDALTQMTVPYSFVNQETDEFKYQ